MTTRVLHTRGRLSLLALTTALLAGCRSDAPTETPASQARVEIVVPATETYEGDVVQLSARVRNTRGDIIPGAPVEFSIAASAPAELSGNTLLFFRPGTVTVTARSANLVTTRDFDVRRLDVSTVTVGGNLPERVNRGDILLIGVRVQGTGGRDVLGRLVELSTDDPSVAVIDPAGRLRTIAAGTVTVRATVEGVVGTRLIEVGAEDVALTLSRVAGVALPVRLENFTVPDGSGGTEEYETWLEAGGFSLQPGSSTRYALNTRQMTYRIQMVNGQRRLLPLSMQDLRDSGEATFDARGDLTLRSALVGSLTHVGLPTSQGMRVLFRAPGSNEVLDLFFRREPE